MRHTAELGHATRGRPALRATCASSCRSAAAWRPACGLAAAGGLAGRALAARAARRRPAGTRARTRPRARRPGRARRRPTALAVSASTAVALPLPGWPPTAAGARRRGRLGLAQRGPAAGGALGDLLGQLLVLRLPLLQVRQHRGGDEDRGVGARQHADEQHERQVLQLAVAEQQRADDQDGRDRQQRGERGVDGPDQGLVQRQVGGLAVGALAGAEDRRRILPDLVEDDDGVVQGVPEDGQQADDRRRD